VESHKTEQTQLNQHTDHRLTTVEQQLKAFEIMHRSFNLKIAGLPASRDVTDSEQMVHLITTRLGIEEMQISKIAYCYRLCTSRDASKPKDILVRFISREERKKYTGRK